MTPDGRYAIASGKLSPTVTIIDAHTLKIAAEPEVGLGPLHTGCFSEEAKRSVKSAASPWKLETGAVQRAVLAVTDQTSKPTLSSTLHTWRAMPASIAGVTRSV
ncbi:MAG: hypothetical protein ABI868_10030 [Acidobacteriota bacterium]